MTADASQVQRLACLEVRGGNSQATYAAELPGLTAWVSCSPLGPSPRGGYLYYFSSCSQGSTARVVIADVAGHGEHVSAAAFRLRYALRQHIDLWDQSLLIKDLNESFLRNDGAPDSLPRSLPTSRPIRGFCCLRTQATCHRSGAALLQTSGHSCMIRRRPARSWRICPWG